jgi:hypothetical protein
LQRGKHNAQSASGRSRLRVKQEGPPEQALRRQGIAVLVLGHREHMKSLEVVWALLKDFFVPGLSFGKLTDPVERRRPSEQDRYVVTLPIGWRRTKSLQLLTHLLGLFLPRGEASTRVVKKMLTIFPEGSSARSACKWSWAIVHCRAVFSNCGCNDQRPG